jgi:predicted DNA-binding transcriptional regulator YafY
VRESRLLSILILLQLRVRLTADALAREFEVSVRTIYRDIDKLSAAGVPIYADRGPGGGFQLIAGYQTKLTGLAADEAEAVFLIGMPAAASALGVGTAATNAGRKLLASLTATSSEAATRLSGRFYLDPVDWYRETEPVTHLPALVRAVLDQRCLQMTYQSWTNTHQWEVEPLGLVMKAGVWYLVAHGRNKQRIFKVSNIVEQKVRETTFEPPVNFDLAAYWQEALVRFEIELRSGTATIRATATGFLRLSQLGAYGLQAVKSAEPPAADGWARCQFPIENIEQAALLFLGIGPEIEVLEPSTLRARISEMAKALVRRHE